MFRLLCGAAVLGLVAAFAGAADETVELKNHKSQVGDRVRVTDEEHTTTRSVVKVGDKTEDKTEKRVKVVIYTSETLAVKKGEKKATKITRLYERAEEVKDGTVTKLPLHGKTIVIEKKGDKYTFTDEDGKALDGKPRDDLDKEFNKKDEDDIDDFIPKRPLKLGESWKMDTDKLLRSLSKEKEPFEVAKKGVTGTGKLVETYTFGGHKYGVYDMRLEFPLTALTGATRIELKPGSKMQMHIVGDGNVEGTEPDGVMTMRLTMRVAFEAPNGAEANIKADGILTRATERLPARKRD
jgi:hypothetical protein